MDSQVSVLIASRGRPDQLLQCVGSVLACDFDSFEVIVVEQAAEPSLLPEDGRLRHVLSSTVGKSAALNEALALATGDILAFTDDDCTVPAGWISRAMEVFRANADVGMVFGSLIAVQHDPTAEFIPQFRPDKFAVVRGPSQSVTRGGAGANMFLRRSAVKAIDGFDARIGPGAQFRSNEEFDIYYRVLRAGFAVARDPANQVLHYGVRSYRDGSGQALVRGYYFGEGVVLGKHVRCGDREALGVARQIVIEQARAIATTLIRERKPTGLGRSAYWLRGFGSGLLTKVDRKRRMFA